MQPDVLPFNFADLGRTLGDIIDSLEDPRITGTEEVDGVESWRVRGNVPSEGLSSLIPTAEPGFEVGLDLWIGLEHNLLRKARIEGQVLSRDDPQVVRLSYSIQLRSARRHLSALGPHHSSCRLGRH